MHCKSFKAVCSEDICLITFFGFTFLQQHYATEMYSADKDVVFSAAHVRWKLQQHVPGLFIFLQSSVVIMSPLQNFIEQAHLTFESFVQIFENLSS